MPGAAFEHPAPPFYAPSFPHSGGSGGGQSAPKSAPAPSTPAKAPAAGPVSTSGGGGSYENIYKYTACVAAEVVRPSSTEDVAAAVKALTARAAAAGKQLKVRATHGAFGSSASFPCAEEPRFAGPGGGSGTAAGGSKQQKPVMTAGILLDKMNRVLAVDRSTGIVRLQPAVTIGAFLKAATDSGLSVPPLSLPAWASLTLGGIVATSAHGSGHNVVSTICSAVTRVTWVDGRGQVRVTGAGDAEYAGICGGIGLLGVITEIEIKLGSSRNVRLVTMALKPDGNMMDEIEGYLKQTPNVIIMWRPDAGLYTAYLQLPAAPGADARTDVAASPFPRLAEPLASMLGTLGTPIQADPDYGNPLNVGVEVSSCVAVVGYLLAGGWAAQQGPGGPVPTLPVFEAVADANRLIAADCGDECLFTSNSIDGYFLDMEIGIEKAQLPEWVAGVKAIVQKDLKELPGGWSQKHCMPPGGFVIRFGQSNNYHVAMATGTKEPVFVQQLTFVFRGSDEPGRHVWIEEAFEQFTLIKLGGRPHWGKNLERTFLDPRSPIADKYSGGIAAMSALQDRFDPSRIFEPQLWTAIKERRAVARFPRCAVQYKCFCAADEHCAPGWRCVASRAFAEFKVCKPGSLAE